MATQIARGHGGDGGGRDPTHNPKHVPSSCQSSVPKKTRKGAKNYELLKAFEDNGYMPLPINFDPLTGEAIGDHSKWFPRWITTLLEDHTVFEYESWQNVPEPHKLQIYTGLFDMFDIASWQKAPGTHWPRVQASIDTVCSNRYRDKKYKLKLHYENAGGSKEGSKAYDSCPKGYDETKWRSLIDNLFKDEKYVKRSSVNKANRAKQLFPSLQGSKSISSQRYDQIQKTGKFSYVETWAKNHSRKGVFVNKHAAETYEKIDQARTDLQCERGTEDVDELEILGRGLGERSGYILGVGRKLKHASPILATSSYMPEPQTSKKKYEELEERSRRQEEEMERMRQEMAEMRALFLRGHSGGESSTPNGSNTNPSSQNDDHEDEDE
ncbi:hypothetical protein SSX86_008180 [Deinandra increscens subsp. villosa]|uniref:Transposase, Ptta/En/Spm, plant n=1 Tax=Deinandra increscens subsp. villosa TaxID=3103831 RepID=A0AAP0DC35_9ASTR